MGEYARRKRDGAQIKIGTCESMYYARYEQLGDFSYSYSTDNLLWRIPTPDEDGIEVGDFNYELIPNNGIIPNMLAIDTTKISKEDCEDMQKVGTMQLTNEDMGLLVNVRCPHGLPLKDKDDNWGVQRKDDDFLVSYGHNGLKNPLYLAFLKNTSNELRVGIRCRCCGSMWALSFKDVEPMVKSLWMKLRLLHQCSDYWYQHNAEPFNVAVTTIDRNMKPLSIEALELNQWQVEGDGEVQASANWKSCRNKFIELLPKLSDIKTPKCWSERPPYYDELSWAAHWGAQMLNRYLNE